MKTIHFSILAAVLLSVLLSAEDVWEKSIRLREGVQYVHLFPEVPRKTALSPEKVSEMREKFIKTATEKKFDLSFVNAIKADVRPMKIYAMRIDLKLQGLAFTGTGRADGWGKPMPAAPDQAIRTYRITTADFMKGCRELRRLNMIVATNSGPWSPWPPPKGDTRHANPAGISISDGVVVSDNGFFAYAYFVVYKDGTVNIIDHIDREKYDDFQLVTSGFGIVMKEGKTTPQTTAGYDEGLMPRLSLGLDKERRYLYIVAVDGRQPGWSEGATGTDLFNIFTRLGAYDVIDMDGGGSATMCFWDERQNAPRIFNMHDYNRRYYRPVGMNLGIYLKPLPPKGK